MRYKVLLLIMFVIFYVQANDTKLLIVDIYPGFGWVVIQSGKIPELSKVQLLQVTFITATHLILD